jgi:hypothetical protein
VAPRDPWEEVERLVDQFYSEVLSRAGRASEGRSNLLYQALVGDASKLSRLERLTVTILGRYAPRFFAVFFESVSPLEPPFDFYGVLRGSEYWVKAVSGDEAFNNHTARAVADASERYPKPVILTLQGGYFEPRAVGRAVWYSAPASWRFVAGEGAYRRFRDVVYETASACRSRLWEELKA